MNRPNVVGLRRLLTSMKNTNFAHAAVLASLPIVSTRKASVQLELPLYSNGAAGRKRVRKISYSKKSV